MKPFLAFAIFSSLIACSSAPPIAQNHYYLSDAAIASFHLDRPPPIGSTIDQDDVKTMLSDQNLRTKQDCERAQKEAQPVSPAYAEFFGGIGPFATPLAGEQKQFISHVWLDAAEVSESFKDQFHWTRAFKLEPALHPCVPKSNSFSYPSGHSILSRVFALVLSDIQPEKKAIYLKRADEIANDRVLAGMHRPSEIAAGKMLADEIYAKLLESKVFRDDVERMRRSTLTNP